MILNEDKTGIRLTCTYYTKIVIKPSLCKLLDVPTKTTSFLSALILMVTIKQHIKMDYGTSEDYKKHQLPIHQGLVIGTKVVYKTINMEWVPQRHSIRGTLSALYFG